VVTPATRPRAIKVLHIEDDQNVARTMARALRLRGFEVASAATRDEVIRHLQVNGFSPDLILTDFQLGPEFTAETIVAEIAARLQFKPPIILMTGICVQSVALSGVFADRVLTKPVDIHVLLREMDELLGARVSIDRQN
jgi:DNA-binding response OmpR family regulator